MIEEIDRLRASAHLARLLEYYAERGTADRTVWQDRLMELDEVEARELSHLHGELMAFEWIELNLGFSTGKPSPAVASCYRVTAAGLRAWKQLQTGDKVNDVLPSAPEPQANTPSHSARPRQTRKKSAASLSQDGQAAPNAAAAVGEDRSDCAPDIRKAA